MSKTSVALPSLVLGLLLLFKLEDDLSSSGTPWEMVVGKAVTETALVVIGVFDGMLSSSAEPITPRRSRHVGHSFTKREMSSFGTLQHQHIPLSKLTDQYHEYTFLT